MRAVIFVALLAVAFAARRRPSEVWNRTRTEAAGIVWRGNHTTPSSHEALPKLAAPDAFTWCNNNGVNYCTMSRNQHLPQYCGSCWAHGSVSALGDRVKIARKAQGIDINLAVQHILNCGGVGSCYGGSVDGPYQWLMEASRKGTGISYETSLPYQACSSDVTFGICPHANFGCSQINIARTCSTFPPTGKCVGLTSFPNVTISDYGSISGAAAMQNEILNRGPITCGIDAQPILEYTTGIVSDAGDGIDHVVSVVGWGKEGNKQYWIVRNSWGEYWGEMGYVRVELGNNALHLEEQCSWAVVKTWTELSNQVHCYEDGSNCQQTIPHVPLFPNHND